MNTKQQLDIDLVKISDVAHIGVRRAAIFMGFGLHAVERDDFNEYQLGKLPIGADQTEMLIDFFPPDLSAEKVKEFKGEFEKWIISTGIKELIEHYALLLDKIHEYSLAVARNAGKPLKRPVADFRSATSGCCPGCGILDSRGEPLSRGEPAHVASGRIARSGTIVELAIMEVP